MTGMVLSILMQYTALPIELLLRTEAEVPDINGELVRISY